jgi:hypothetical protein
MSILEAWIDWGNAFAKEVARLILRAGADGQVPARNLASALAVLDPPWWQLVKVSSGSSGLGGGRA